MLELVKFFNTFMILNSGEVKQWHSCKQCGDPDPEPDPDSQDPHFLGPPGSGSISQRYGSGSGSGSFPFLIDVLSELKQCLQNRILTQIFSKKFNFLD
jgi:hypothetical protein